MKAFSEFGIQPVGKKFTGDKIKISKVLNVPIAVHDFKIEDSKFGEPGAKRLVLQLELNGEKRIIFTASKVLMEMIQRVALADFPFTTTIIEKDDEFQFT